MTLHCPSCDSPIDEDTIRDRGVANCKNCNATVRFDRVASGWQVSGYTDAAPPSGLTVHIDEPPPPKAASYRDSLRPVGRFEASYRWFSPKIIFLTFFAIGWDSFLVTWYASAFMSPPGGGGGFMMLLFPLIHVAVGVGLTWHVLTGWFNRTRIEVKEGRLSANSGPLPTPWRRSKELTLQDVEYFEAKRSSRKFKNEMAAPPWDVVARTSSGSDVVAVAGVPMEHARYLAQRLERHLGTTHA